jgi:hypothetical protein
MSVSIVSVVSVMIEVLVIVQGSVAYAITANTEAGAGT